MTNKKFTARAEIDAEIARLVKLRESLPEELKLWQPKYDTDYCYVDLDGTIGNDTWFNNGTDQQRQAYGNCYPRPEQAERRAAQIRVENLERQFEDGGKYVILVDRPEDETLQVFAMNFLESQAVNRPRYSTKERAQAVIDFIGLEAYEKAYGRKE